jgi:hypothetical protein
VGVADAVAGAVFEQEITADLPAATQFLSPRPLLNTGTTAAAVACDCAGRAVTSSGSAPPQRAHGWLRRQKVGSVSTPFVTRSMS